MVHEVAQGDKGYLRKTGDIAKHKSAWRLFRSPDCFVLCDLQIFSGSVYHLKQPHAQSLFLFPIVFGINLIPFFDGKKDGAAVHMHSINCCQFFDYSLSHWRRRGEEHRFSGESVNSLRRFQRHNVREAEHRV